MKPQGFRRFIDKKRCNSFEGEGDEQCWHPIWSRKSRRDVLQEKREGVDEVNGQRWLTSQGVQWGTWTTGRGVTKRSLTCGGDKRKWFRVYRVPKRPRSFKMTLFSLCPPTIGSSSRSWVKLHKSNYHN